SSSSSSSSSSSASASHASDSSGTISVGSSWNKEVKQLNWWLQGHLKSVVSKLSQERGTGLSEDMFAFLMTLADKLIGGKVPEFGSVYTVHEIPQWMASFTNPINYGFTQQYGHLNIPRLPYNAGLLLANLIQEQPKLRRARP